MVENQYIAEQKFKAHLQGNMTYSQIRQNLGKTYGGFTSEGQYFHNENIH